MYVRLARFNYLCFINTLRPIQNGRHFADDMFKCIFLNENVWILIEISLKFVPKGSFNNNPALFQIMAWRRPGDKPLSEQLVSSLTHICVTRPQLVNSLAPVRCSNNFENKIFNLIILNNNLSTGCDITLRWTTQNLIDERSTLV